MTIQVQSENRKALIKAISEHLGQEQHYDGPPSFNYRVGAVTITRDCSIIGEQEDLEALKSFLEERGYPVSECLEDGAEQQCAEPEPQSTEPEQIQEPEPEPQSAEAESIQEPELEPQSAEPEQIQEPEPEPQSAEPEQMQEPEPEPQSAEPEQMQESETEPQSIEAVSIQKPEPENSPEKPPAVETEAESNIQETVITHNNTALTVASLTNLISMLYSKQYLLGKALGQQTIHISDEVIQELQAHRPENMEVFTERIAEFRDQELIVGFDFKDDAVSMTFPYCEEEPTRWMVYAQLITRMMQKATEVARVRPELLIPEAQSEKYYMNGWLLRLGYGGVDSKEQRRILMEKLQGYAAFKTTAGMDKHKEKYSALRRAARKAQKVVTEDGE